MSGRSEPGAKEKGDGRGGTLGLLTSPLLQGSKLEERERERGGGPAQERLGAPALPWTPGSSAVERPCPPTPQRALLPALEGD